MSVNLVILIGRVGRDPEIKLVGGQQVANFSIAVTEIWKDKDGNKGEHTEWVSIETWGKTAEFASQYVKKGRQLYVQGSLRVDATGEGTAKRYFPKVRAQIVRLLGPKPQEEGGEL